MASFGLGSLLWSCYGTAMTKEDSSKETESDCSECEVQKSKLHETTGHPENSPISGQPGSKHTLSFTD